MSGYQLPDWLRSSLNYLHSTPTNLPFPLALAFLLPRTYAPLVTDEKWETEVIEPTLHSYFEGDPVFKRPGLTSMLGNADETSYIKCYETGLAVARAHQAIWKSQFAHVNDDFESFWKGHPPNLQREFVARALVNATKLMHSVPLRIECPDLSISQLCDDEGRGLMRIIRTIVQSAVEFPKSDNCIAVVSETWDRFYEVDRTSEDYGAHLSPLAKLHQRTNEHRRNYFIALFVASLFNLFGHYGAVIEPNQAIDKPRLQSSKKDWYRSNSFDSRIASLWDQAIERNHPDQDGNFSLVQLKREQYEIACRTCARFAVEVKELVEADKTDLSCCSRCLQMGRSMDCQRLDWRTVHRNVCGKQLVDINLPQPLSPSASNPPLSLSLQLQISRPYTKSEEDDYIYTFRFHSTPPPTAPSSRPFEVVHLAADAKSHEYLEQAIASRSHEDIRRFVEYIIFRHDFSPMTPEVWKAMASQIAAEWDIDVFTAGTWVVQTLMRKADARGTRYL